MKKLIDTVELWDDGVHDGVRAGIFHWIDVLANDRESEPEVVTIPWIDETIAQSLDNDYYLVHSGSKYVSCVYERIKKLIDDEKLSLSSVEQYLASSIINKFRESWNKIYDAMTTEYAPLENYDMTQKETPNVTHAKTVKQDLTTENDGYGFNSGDAVHVSKSKISGASLNNEETNTETGTRDLTRHGNIGVTTSQQMLLSEIDLRSKYHFIEQIFNDVDSILCLLVY